jgi:hypothetical protein
MRCDCAQSLIKRHEFVINLDRISLLFVHDYFGKPPQIFKPRLSRFERRVDRRSSFGPIVKSRRLVCCCRSSAKDLA